MSVKKGLGAFLPSAAPLKFFAPVAQLLVRRASNAEVAGEIPAGSAISIYDFRFTILDLAACGSPRTAEGPVSETVSLGGAIPLTPTNLFVSIRNRNSKL